MKLVNISRSENTYEVKALHPIKILSIHIMAFIKTYKLSDDHTYWYNLNSEKKVSRKQRFKLDKWLKDHQKFIEKK